MNQSTGCIVYPRLWLKGAIFQSVLQDGTGNLSWAFLAWVRPQFKGGMSIMSSQVSPRMQKVTQPVPPLHRVNKRAGREGNGEAPSGCQREVLQQPSCSLGDVHNPRRNNPCHSPCQPFKGFLGSSHKFRVPPQLIPHSFASHQHWLVSTQVRATGWEQWVSNPVMFRRNAYTSWWGFNNLLINEHSAQSSSNKFCVAAACPKGGWEDRGEGRGRGGVALQISCFILYWRHQTKNITSKPPWGHKRCFLKVGCFCSLPVLQKSWFQNELVLLASQQQRWHLQACNPGVRRVTGSEPFDVANGDHMDGSGISWTAWKVS